MVDQQTVQEWSIPSFDESNGGFDLPDEGFYKFELASVGEPEAVSPQYDPTGQKRRALFTFKIKSDEEDMNHGLAVRRWFTISMNEKSALYPFIKAMKGGKIDAAERINPHRLLGATFNAVVTHETKEDGRVFPKIESPTVDRNSTHNSGGAGAPF